jgi:hypothetical protein
MKYSTLNVAFYSLFFLFKGVREGSKIGNSKTPAVSRLFLTLFSPGLSVSKRGELAYIAIFALDLC